MYLNSSSNPNIDLISITDPRDSQHSFISSAWQFSCFNPSVISYNYSSSNFPGLSAYSIISRIWKMDLSGLGTTLLKISARRFARPIPCISGLSASVSFARSWVNIYSIFLWSKKPCLIKGLISPTWLTLSIMSIIVCGSFYSTWITWKPLKLMSSPFSPNATGSMSS